MPGRPGAERGQRLLGDALAHPGLERLAGEYGTTEIGVVTLCFDFAARVRSYELLAEAFPAG